MKHCHIRSNNHPPHHGQPTRPTKPRTRPTLLAKDNPRATKVTPHRPSKLPHYVATSNSKQYVSCSFYKGHSSQPTRGGPRLISWMNFVGVSFKPCLGTWILGNSAKRLELGTYYVATIQCPTMDNGTSPRSNIIFEMNWTSTPKRRGNRWSSKLRLQPATTSIFKVRQYNET